MYYLQSRYYDAEIGRFLNADGYITTGQGILSYNMYAYCGNNPVMLYDFNGFESKVLRFFKNLFCGSFYQARKTSSKSFLEDFLDSVISTKKQGNTCSVGYGYGYTSGGVSQSKSKVISSDTSYNFAIQETSSSGMSCGEGAGLNLMFSVTNANNVNDLNGESQSYGFTLTGLLGISIEITEFAPASDPGKICYGFGFAISIGGEVEVHYYENETTTSKYYQPVLKIKEKLYG